MTSMTPRQQLIDMARRDLAYGRKGEIDLVDDIYQVPVERYFDQDRWEQERRQVFRRLPLMLATTAEVRDVGAYKAMEAAGVQVIITRTRSGLIKAFVNMCSHRGARLMDPGTGTAHRFTCPYHGWSYGTDGQLATVYAAEDFGDIDKSTHGLTELPSLEKAGLIWVCLDAQSPLNIADFLSGYDEPLSEFGFDTWHHEHTQVVDGPNWKVAYDGYLDYYHLPILHRNTFGTDIGNRAHYYNWGPHIHMGRPDTGFEEFSDTPEADWPTDRLLGGVWTIFPHISIASFSGGGRSVMISQLFPGDTPGSSYTNQIFLMEQAPATEQLKAEAAEQFQFLKHVVEKEDYATGLALQKNLNVGAKTHVMFGRNEGGGQQFHKWVDKIVNASNSELPSLFQTS